MHECAGKIGMANIMASSVETVPPAQPAQPGQPVPPPQPPKAKYFCNLTKRQIANGVFFVINLVILGMHSLVVMDQNPGVDAEILNHKYPQFFDIIAAHKSQGDAEDQTCTTVENCKISLSDLVEDTKIHPTGEKAVIYQDKTLWNYYLNTVIRNQYEKVGDDGTCLTGVCGEDNTKDGKTVASDGTTVVPCKWCDFNFGNSSTSYSITECQDNIRDRGRIFVGNMITHLLVVAVCCILLSYMPEETELKVYKQYDNYIRCLIWLGASLFLLGNFGYIFRMLIKDHDADNICNDILTEGTMRWGAILYIILSSLYFIVTLIVMRWWTEGKTVDKTRPKPISHAQGGGVAYALIQRV